VQIRITSGPGDSNVPATWRRDLTNLKKMDVLFIEKYTVSISGRRGFYPAMEDSAIDLNGLERTGRRSLRSGLNLYLIVPQPVMLCSAPAKRPFRQRLSSGFLRPCRDQTNRGTFRPHSTNQSRTDVWKKSPAAPGERRGLPIDYSNGFVDYAQVIEQQGIITKEVAVAALSNWKSTDRIG